ncbi:MAG: helix-turn-helix domain-containing protein, partial [Thermodesulfobacteriota bacterium]
KDISPEFGASTFFRPDLYYRLNVFSIELPPLRARKEDIRPLSEAFLAKMNGVEGSRKILSKGALDVMCKYDWPGNVRELENSIRRAFYVARDENMLEPRHLPKSVIGYKARLPASGAFVQERILGPPLLGREPPTGCDGAVSLHHTEEQKIARAIAVSGHNMSRASRMLGISRSTLYRKVKSLSIAVPDDFPYRRAGG